MSLPRYLLASDLDGTLIPLERNPQRAREVDELVAAIESTGSLMLAYVTGRHLSLAQEGIAEVGLPEPDWFVCDVGTSVYRQAHGGYEPDQGYRRAMRAAFGGIDGAGVQVAIGSIDGLDLQEEEKQAEFKVSYYTEGRPVEWVRSVEQRLGAAGANVNVVPSYDPVTRRGLIDVLPAGIAKDYAIRYLHDRVGVDDDHLIYAGDSGNDRAAMLTGYRAIIVGNADADLKKDLAEQAQARGITEQLYFAKHPYARGVLEGLQHFGVFR